MRLLSTYQVNANVSQYATLHATSKALSGSHIPCDSPSSLRLDARSIGTNNINPTGRASARNTGVRRYPGVERKGR